VRIDKEKGQSLVGVVVFTIILMILVLSLTGATIWSYALNKRARDRAEAQDIAKNIIETTKIWAGSSEANFDALVENEVNSTRAIPAIPTIRPAIPADPPENDRLYTDFYNIPKVNGAPKYVVQFLVKDYQSPGSSIAIMKRITVRVYYAKPNGKINTSIHKPGSGAPPKRYENPLAELAGVVTRP
jgi:hypothetical protein